MRLRNDRFASPIRVCQLPCHERGEVLFGNLEVTSDPPGKSFVSKFTKPTQEALSTSLGGRNQLDLHSRIHARTFRRVWILAKTARRCAVPSAQRGKRAARFGDMIARTVKSVGSICVVRPLARQAVSLPSCGERRPVRARGRASRGARAARASRVACRPKSRSLRARPSE